MISVMRAVDKITSARASEFPHPSFVPPPRGITASPASFESRNISASSLSVPGSITSFGCAPETASAAVAACTYSFPTRAMNL